MSRDITLQNLAEPNLNLSIRQDGNTVFIDLNVPRTSGSFNQTPFNEVTRNERENLLNGARTEFLQRLNAAGIDVQPITFNNNQTTNANVGANATLPVRGVPVGANASIGFEITSEVRGGVNVRSGVVGDAIRGAEERFDRDRHNTYIQRAEEWRDNGGATIRDANGDLFRVPGGVAGQWRQDQYWLVDPRRHLGSNDVAPGDTLASNNAPRRDDPLRASIRDGVGGLDLGRLGVTDRQQADNLVAALDERSRANGLTRIDAVVASNDGQRIFAVQGDPGRADHLRASVETTMAVRQSVETSDRMIRESAATVAVEPVAQETRARSLG